MDEPGKSKSIWGWLLAGGVFLTGAIWILVLYTSQSSPSLTDAPMGENLQSEKDLGNLGIGDQTTSPEELKSYEKYKTAQNILTGDIQKGTGAEATKDKTVAISYKGYLTDGTLFSQTTDKAYAFTVGKQGTILGMQQGVVGMKVGGKRRIIIPPAMGYGQKANGPIPANSVLVFDVELLSVR